MFKPKTKGHHALFPFFSTYCFKYLIPSKEKNHKKKSGRKAMKKETEYKIMRILTIVFVAFGVAFSVVQEQIILTLVFLIIAVAVNQVLKARYKSVVFADERTKRISEKAGLTTFWFFICAGAGLIILQLILHSLGLENEPLKAFVEPLSYIILALMMIYNILYVYYSRKM
jgi:uncharacterized membrane protein